MESSNSSKVQSTPVEAVEAVAESEAGLLKTENELLKGSAQRNAVECWPEILATVVRGRKPVLFLDYDGTLAPIVKDPDRAFMGEGIREALERATDRSSPTSPNRSAEEGAGRRGAAVITAIISGRAREKVKSFVQLEGVFYAGSHGFDISGPPVASFLSSQWMGHPKGQQQQQQRNKQVGGELSPGSPASSNSSQEGGGSSSSSNENENGGVDSGNSSGNSSGGDSSGGGGSSCSGDRGRASLSPSSGGSGSETSETEVEKSGAERGNEGGGGLQQQEEQLQQLEPLSVQVGEEFRPLLEAVKTALEAELASVRGAAVEDNKLALSVHYRNVVDDDENDDDDDDDDDEQSDLNSVLGQNEHKTGKLEGGDRTKSADTTTNTTVHAPVIKAGPAAAAELDKTKQPAALGVAMASNAKGVAKVFEAVRRQVEKHPNELELRQGKMVIEIRPHVDWNKGAAMLFLLDKLGLLSSSSESSSGSSNRDSSSSSSGNSNGGETTTAAAVAHPPPPPPPSETTTTTTTTAAPTVPTTPTARGGDTKSNAGGGCGGVVVGGVSSGLLGLASGGAACAAVREDVCPFYLGDDVTDEDAFLALRRLSVRDKPPQSAQPWTRQSAGVGILVRSDGETERMAESHASFKVRSPAEVRVLIGLIAAAAEAYHEAPPASAADASEV